MTQNFHGTIVILQGASASGKSRLLAGMTRIARENGLVLNINIPVRYTTRLPRDKESFDKENHYLSREEFQLYVQTNQIDVYWRRPTGAGRENLYGFNLTQYENSNSQIILSTNNYFDWTSSPLLVKLREQGRVLVVRVVASQATRTKRLTARQPPLSPEEFAARMKDVNPDQLPPADFVIPNDEMQQPFAEWELCRLLSYVRLEAMHYAMTGVNELRAA